jgi:hypothetical protein
MYRHGRGGPVDLDQAFYWFSKAAQAGQLNAETSLGDMYEKGEGVKRDYRAADFWYRRAAISGNLVAQLSLAEMLEAGEGIKQDVVAALGWYTLASRTPASSANPYYVEESKKANERRNLLAKRLSHTERAIAEDLADRWVVGNDLPTQQMQAHSPENADLLVASGPPEASLPSGNASDALARVQAGCDIAHGYRSFRSEVRCIEDGIRASPDLAATTVSADLELYTLTADNLVDEVSRKVITRTVGRVELQKAFLEFRDLVNRQNAETTAKAEAAQLQAQQAAASARAARERDNQRLAAAQAAAGAEQREIERRQEELVAFCVSEANERLAANPVFVSDHIHLGLFETSYGAGTYRNVDHLCAKDNYWYKQVPPPQKIITCSRSPGWGGVNCTEQ